MPRIPDLINHARGKALVYLGAGLAIAGAGTAVTAGLAAGPAAAPSAPAASQDLGRVHDVSATLDMAVTGLGARQGGTISVSNAVPRTVAASQRPAGGPVSHRANSQYAPARHAPARTATHTASTRRATRHSAGRKRSLNWQDISRIVANHTNPRPGRGTLPAADKLTPVGTSGPQAQLPVTPARWHNANVIVRQTLARKMGMRSAVIAVATSMQESGLLNVGYGTSDSLGLFQQRPSMGWGSPRQIMRPSYAADAFLSALHRYQAHDPAWAHQPLWQTAQGVQGSAFPSAYAKWEAQAAHLVSAIIRHRY